ncbi:MAG: DUF3575 domain-containing protein [Bacteroidales bacterium]|nr:DUF3575 domain-containing protein [Bacteroidales bacterium]
MALCTQAKAQKVAVGTNLLSYANFLTTNIDISYAVAKNWSVYIQGKYNPWTFKENQPAQEHMQNRQLTFAAGTRYYPWHVYTGWWASASAQYTKYNTGGIIKTKTWEGEVYGISLGAGYSWLLNKHLNMDFGIGLLVGPNKYITYACPECGRMDEGKQKKIYVGPNELLVKLSYLF